ncbi:GNAT family N-acetyltransferase [Allobranchiibius sp. CTAmp26]|uniref:GNAT family N-acetyltransferase n=1 Tax=Allobranchiibius sp. CTAmp26 TaxID=2815214 RepID=UPI001AA198B3|nr:GNAT family protein [Allobranchiibius sp. CTAmp26]MBO1756762.1 GNAT family N-acetyltransferase [Allobranchiibius sp. CTAmp26]
MTHPYALLNVRVSTPRLKLRGATDELLSELAPLVRDGQAMAHPAPYDDPMSLYDDDQARRVDKWLRGVWRARGTVGTDFWRLCLAVVVDERAVGMQDVIGDRFDRFGTVVTFSWLAGDVRGRGLGGEMRAAALHLAFAGLDAREVSSDAFVDNDASNAVSRGLGYSPNGTTWDTRRGEPALLQRWRLTREAWEVAPRTDISLHGVEGCRAAFEPAVTPTPPGQADGGGTVHPT